MHVLRAMIKLIRSVLFSVTLIFFTVLFLLPQEYLAEQVFHWWDKAQHSVAFAILTVTGFWSHPKHSKALFVLLLCYGGLIEVLQFLSGWRQGDLVDWVADSIGVFICYGLRWLWFTRLSGLAKR